jgi:hypothetical protein
MERRSAVLICEPYEDLNDVRPAPGGLRETQKLTNGVAHCEQGFTEDRFHPGNPEQREEVRAS